MPELHAGQIVTAHDAKTGAQLKVPTGVVISDDEVWLWDDIHGGLVVRLDDAQFTLRSVLGAEAQVYDWDGQVLVRLTDLAVPAGFIVKGNAGWTETNQLEHVRDAFTTPMAPAGPGSPGAGKVSAGDSAVSKMIAAARAGQRPWDLPEVRAALQPRGSGPPWR